MEILAPVGDEESFYAAINNFADAIYMGLGTFNARAKSTFFNTQNIAKYIRLAHLFNVKVHITLNTLIEDKEFEKLGETVDICVGAKADAFIVQDLGVLNFLIKNYQNIVIHASTQMGIHNLEGAKIAESLGVKRVVLSREAKTEDIIQIKQNTNLELEYFVQGALCVGFSGNCYISSILKKESGNRGKCLQLCRYKYDAYDKTKKLKSGYLLSARDLCLIKSLKTLKDAGVDSLKIEGRLRRAGYVAQSVSSYRYCLDNLDKNIDFDSEILKLKKVFSRGDFNQRAYLEGNTNVINPLIQNHLGTKIGKILKCENFKDLYRITIKSNHPLSPNDGLKCLDNMHEEVSLGVGNVEKISDNIYQIYSKRKVKADWDVYLILDYRAEQNLLNNKRKISLKCFVKALADQPLSITLSNDLISVTHSSDYICTKAITQETDKVQIMIQINKTTDTVFTFSHIDIDTNEVFIPKSILNELRRTALNLAEQKIIEFNEKSIHTSIKEQKIYPSPKVMDDISEVKGSIYIIDDINQLNSISITKDDIIGLAPQEYSVEEFNKLITSLDKFNTAIYLPNIANHKDIKIIEKVICKYPNLPLIINNLYGTTYKNALIAGPEMNITNYGSVEVLKNLGVSKFVFSKELHTYNTKFYNSNKGNAALMYFCHCPIQTIYNNDCANCKYSNNITLKSATEEHLPLKRLKLSQCYFTLYKKLPLPKEEGYFKDLRV